MEGFGIGTYTLTVSIVDDHGDTAEDGVERGVGPGGAGRPLQRHGRRKLENQDELVEWQAPR